MQGRFVYLSACLVAILSALGGQPEDCRRNSDAFPGWPTHMEGRALRAVPLTERERTFYEHFPGEVARFSDGRDQLVLRWIAEPTERLHPAAMCFRGRGFDWSPRSGWRDAHGMLWGRARAQRDGEELEVFERVWSEEGESWPDVAAWYWDAVLGRTKGPWWAVLRARESSENRTAAVNSSAYARPR